MGYYRDAACEDYAYRIRTASMRSGLDEGAGLGACVRRSASSARCTIAREPEAIIMLRIFLLSI